MIRTRLTATATHTLGRLVAGLGVVLAVVLGSAALPATAGAQQGPHTVHTTASGHGNEDEQAAEDSGGATQAIIVGGLAFVLMVGAGGAVLWFTARSRHGQEH